MVLHLVFLGLFLGTIRWWLPRTLELVLLLALNHVASFAAIWAISLMAG